MPKRLVNFALSRTYGRYLLTSVVSLGCDIATFLALLEAKMEPTMASAVAYLVGIIVHWLFSTRFVFENGMTSRGLARTRQKGMFLVTALIGLAVTTAIVGLAASTGLDPRLAKLAAVIVSFQLTYIARRATLFRG
jgi:putative flippase GtrA